MVSKKSLQPKDTLHQEMQENKVIIESLNPRILDHFLPTNWEKSFIS